MYGFNDGLTANFGLVAGVLGADVAPHIVIISGVAGAIADALSMGSSGYLAAKSEAEVQAHQIDLERHEMRLMPDLEEEELAIIYEAKGLPRRSCARNRPGDDAGSVTRARRDGARGTEHSSGGTRAGQGWSRHRDGDGHRCASSRSCRSLLLDHGTAIWTSLAVSMLAHFAIGAARSVFTGRSVWASGRDMFVVGFGVAAIGYFDR